MICSCIVRRLSNVAGKISTLEIAVEPFGLRAADVARPPPRVGVARRAPQHRGLLPPLSPPYPVLPLSLVPIRPNLPLVRMILLLPLLALHWSWGGGQDGAGRAPGREEARRWPWRKPWRDRGIAGQVRCRGWIAAGRGGGWLSGSAAGR